MSYQTRSQLLGQIEKLKKRITNLEKKTPVKNKIPVFNEKLLNALSDGFLILNEKYEHILVNKALCKITGYSRKELISVKPPFPYWPADKIWI